MADVFSGQPIGIFESIEQLKVEPDQLKTWTKLEQHELHLRMSMAPRNYFEKMAYWTEEGKVWHFPIDNEQGDFDYACSGNPNAMNTNFNFRFFFSLA